MLNEKSGAAHPERLTWSDKNEFTLTVRKPFRAKNLEASKAISVFFDNYT